MKTPDTIEAYKAALSRKPLHLRLTEALSRVHEITTNGRVARMSIPLHAEDDDFFCCQTIKEAAALLEPKSTLEERCAATWDTCYPERRKWAEMEPEARQEWLRVFSAFDSTCVQESCTPIVPEDSICLQAPQPTAASASSVSDTPRTDALQYRWSHDGDIDVEEILKSHGQLERENERLKSRIEAPMPSNH